MFTRSVLDDALAGLIATGGALDPASTYLGLFTGITDNGPNTVLGDLTQATGKMATRSKITAWGSPYNESDGSAVVDGPICKFSPLNSGEAAIILGFFLADAANAGNLLMFKALSAPVALNDETNQLSIVPRPRVTEAGLDDVSVAWDGGGL